MDRLYTIPEAAEYLRVTRAAVYKWIKQGKIVTVYVGSERRITQSALNAFVKASTDERLARGDTIDEDTEAPMLIAGVALEPA